MAERRRFRRDRRERRDETVHSTENWVPRTNLGKLVFEGKVSLEEIFQKGYPIKESEIVDRLVPNLRSEIILIGGSPGKGGGIKRTPTLRTARMHRSGRRYKITAMTVVGNGNGYIGLGIGNANDHREAIAKSLEDAKLNIMPVRRGCGSWRCGCGTTHSIPFKASGKRGSIEITLMPAPKGTGLMVSEEVKKIMMLAGIKDIWSKTEGNTRSRRNMCFATFDAFRSLNKMKIPFPEDELKTTTVEMVGEPAEKIVEEVIDEVEDILDISDKEE